VRFNLTATLLPDGRVLIAGGRSEHSIGTHGIVTYSDLVSAEFYDPKSGRFSPTGSMAAARDGHIASLLSDGRVLIAGGDDWATTYLASAELYDPRTGSFSQAGSMTVARWFAAATTLGDGRVLITGGRTTGPMHLASAEVYQP
jgi:hypothetical protein